MIPHILVVMPTRSRGASFPELFRKYVVTIDRSEYVSFLITCDTDDGTMTPEVVEICHRLYPDVTFVFGVSVSKIHACNRDISGYAKAWDIAMLASDDMIPQHKGWDTMIRTEMLRHYPDYDGTLWFNDGHQSRISTLCIMGRKYMGRFGYFYHPAYISLWCDNEYTEVAIRLKRMQYYPHVLFYHNHPSWTGNKSLNDALYDKNEKYYRVDERTFNDRKRAGFPR